MKASTITGVLAVLYGISVIASEGITMTGAFAGTKPASFLLPLSGTLIILLGIAALRKGLEHKIMLTSVIKMDSGLHKLTKEAVRNQYVKRDLDHLTYELAKGNFQAGIGLGYIQGTDVNEMRGRRGGRLYFRRIGPEHYEIVAKSGKGNQERVIKKLQELYPA